MPTLDEVLAIAALQRIAERAVVFLFVVILAAILAWVYRKTVQKIDFSITADKVGAGGVIALAMPVFLLLVMVGFGYIVFSQPVSIRAVDEVTKPEAPAAAEPAASSTALGNVAVSPVGADIPRGEGSKERIIQEMQLRLGVNGPKDSLLNPDQVIASLGIVQEFIRSAKVDDPEARRRLSLARRIFESHLGNLVDSRFHDGAFTKYLEIREKLSGGQITIGELDLTAEEEDAYVEIDGLFSGAGLSEHGSP